MCAIIITFYRRENWGMEKLSNLFEVIQLVIELKFELRILVSEIVCLITLVYCFHFCDDVGFWFVSTFGFLSLHQFTSFWLYVHNIEEDFIYSHFIGILKKSEMSCFIMSFRHVLRWSYIFFLLLTSYMLAYISWSILVAGMDSSGSLVFFFF